MIYYNYINLFIYFLTALFFSFILVFLSFCLDNLLFFKARKDFEKISSYECGFQPFSDARGTVDVKFYLVAILFIIFDLEITFLIP
jgi:NADH:ubiquinone oxidoreductase subunit 3 (subunit A)